MKAFLTTQSVTLIAIILSVLGCVSQTLGQTRNAPEVVAAVAPVFPPIARAAHSGGDVVIEVSINADGTVHSTKVISGAALLQKVSEVAAKKWKFASSSEKNRAIQVVFGFVYVDGRQSDPEYTITFKPPYRVEVAWNAPAPGY